MSQPSIQELQAGLGRLAEKARTDRAFNDLCRKDPAQALRQVAGPELPGGCTLRCLEVEQGEILIPLPEWNPSYTGQELSDSQLDAVAGGTEEALSRVITVAAEDGRPIVEGLGVNSFRTFAYSIADEGTTIFVDSPKAAPRDLAVAGAAITGGFAMVGSAITGFFSGW